MRLWPGTMLGVGDQVQVRWGLFLSPEHLQFSRWDSQQRHSNMGCVRTGKHLEYPKEGTLEPRLDGRVGPEVEKEVVSTGRGGNHVGRGTLPPGATAGLESSYLGGKGVARNEAGRRGKGQSETVLSQAKFSTGPEMSVMETGEMEK